MKNRHSVLDTESTFFYHSFRCEYQKEYPMPLLTQNRLFYGEMKGAIWQRTFCITAITWKYSAAISKTNRLTLSILTRLSKATRIITSSSPSVTAVGQPLKSTRYCRRLPCIAQSFRAKRGDNHFADDCFFLSSSTILFSAFRQTSG